MTADTPPSEVVERLRKSAARREWGNDYKEQLHVEAADTIAALLRERDAQAKVIAHADTVRNALCKIYNETMNPDPAITPYEVWAYDEARAGLNTQGSGNG